MLEEDKDLLNAGPSKGFIAAIAAAILCLVFGGYAMHEHNVTRSLNSRNSQLQASVKAQDSQLNQLTAAVNQLAAQQQQAAAAAKPSPATVRHVADHHRSAHRGLYDSRYRKLQSQLDAQGKAIADTRNDLTNARTEFSGGIAKNHTELVVLERKGERNYYEFDILKTNQFQNHGDVGIRLRKANTKHQYADLQLLVDDRNLTQKHVNLYQPVVFYTPDSPQPIELVINDITKNHIHGYVSVSKYSQSELAAMSNSTNGNTDSQPPQRKQLPVPAAPQQ
jgi:hypothetical protein